MSNPTELPDLDKLEAMAKAADQDGHHIYTHPRDSNRAEENQMWQRVASPAAVLALIALARRAQPEGEAPQAEMCKKCHSTAAIYARNGVCSECGGNEFVACPKPAATLSPLCGAQHAESGDDALDRELDGYAALTERQLAKLDEVNGQHAESGKDADAAEKAAAYDELNRIAELHGFASAAAAIAAARRAAQQAAAPEQFCDANCVWTDHHKDCTISAPGTPEAPADDGEKEFARGVIAVLGVLTPHGYTHGSVLHDEIVSTIGAKVIYRHAEDEDYAWAGLNPRKKPRKRAAQLDGGQEGSESNG